MELFRRMDNPWGQDVLIGVSWDLMWVAVWAAVAFLIGHAIWIKTRGDESHDEGDAASAAGIPEKIERHTMAARVFHWTMSVAMLALLITAFGPVMGWQFPWIEIHWMAGVLLTATIVYHMIHAIGWQDFWSMFQLGVSEGVAHTKHILSSKAPSPPKAGKYPFDHRMYHHAIVVVAGTAIVTGVLMMTRIDTPFWERNPYGIMSDSAWGVTYVLHGLSGVMLILLVASHIYFALRPEKRWITWSMINGMIDREKYLQHHDPTKWDVSDGGVTAGDAGGGGAIAEPAASAPVEGD